ncbi:MAG TPA: ATP-binding protein [Candidatus Lokiarchaeia archaeon]|nr:ATP-binding protein [Candidatus Lokiarchaeia archaeon]
MAKKATGSGANVQPNGADEFLPDDLKLVKDISESTIESEGVELVPASGIREFATDEVGEVVGAAVTVGITVKMIREPETLRVGTPLIVEGGMLHFYSLTTDIAYPASNIAVAFANSPMASLLPVKDVPGVRGSPFYALASLNCLAILEPTTADAGDEAVIQRPFDTIPRLLSKVRLARQDDLRMVFRGSENSGVIGGLNGIEELQVPIDFLELIKVPFGVFGSTGSGKSVFTKILSSWIVKLQLASLVIFDVMGEYTWRSHEGDTPGLAALFGDRQVITMALDQEKAPMGAEEFFLYKENVSAGDLLTALSDQDLTTPQINSIDILYEELTKGTATKDNLIDYILDITEKTKPDAVNAKTVNALKNRVRKFANLPFLRTGTPEEQKETPDSLKRILELLRNKKTIILNFGRFTDDKAYYMFIANIVTRRIRHEFSKNEGTYPQTVILLEEAHKFLSPEVGQFSIFGKIAREMRKYGLTLGIVDQRPSQIHAEVFSQLANRFILRLSDPKDVDAALSGVGEASQWKGILRGLQNRQVVAMGTCITVPSIVTPWTFNDANAKTMLGLSKIAKEVKTSITDEDVADI